MKKTFLALAAVALLAGPMAAQAIPITYDFTVNGGPSGPLAGVTSSGFFTFDDSIIPVGGGSLFQTGLLDDLSFAWNGFAYDATSANTGSLAFDASGALTSGLFGTDCSAVSCVIAANDPNSFALYLSPGGLFAYEAGEQLFTGGTVQSVSLREVNSVPEPGTLALLGLGLAALGLTRRRQSA